MIHFRRSDGMYRGSIFHILRPLSSRPPPSLGREGGVNYSWHCTMHTYIYDQQYIKGSFGDAFLFKWAFSMSFGAAAALFYEGWCSFIPPLPISLSTRLMSNKNDFTACSNIQTQCALHNFNGSLVRITLGFCQTNNFSIWKTSTRAIRSTILIWAINF